MDGGGGIGGGADIVDVGDATANFDPVEIELAVRVLEARRGKHGDGVVANIGG